MSRYTCFMHLPRSAISRNRLYQPNSPTNQPPHRIRYTTIYHCDTLLLIGFGVSTLQYAHVKLFPVTSLFTSIYTLQTASRICNTTNSSLHGFAPPTPILSDGLAINFDIRPGDAMLLVLLSLHYKQDADIALYEVCCCHID